MASRNWCFTLNNPKDDFKLDNTRVRYSIYQREQGESGTPHIQGYVSFTAPQRLSFCRNYVPAAHWEIRRGTEEEASAYCCKEEGRLSEPIVFGKLAQPGRRNDLALVKRDLDAGHSMKRIAEDHFAAFVRYSSGFERYKRLKVSPTKPTADVCLIYGPTGTGKSHFLNEDYPKAYWKQNSIWWDDYNGEETVIVDEFYGWLPYTEMLRICDKYPLLLQTKGGQVRAKFKRVFFTSNSLPRSWYDWDKPNLNWAPFIRRFTSFLYFKSKETHLYFESYDDFIKAVI